MRRIVPLLVLFLLAACSSGMQPTSAPTPTNSIEMVSVEVNPPKQLSIPVQTGERMAFCMADIANGNAEADVYIMTSQSYVYTPNGPSFCNLVDLTDLGGKIRPMLDGMIAGIINTPKPGQTITLRMHSDDPELQSLSKSVTGK